MDYELVISIHHQKGHVFKKEFLFFIGDIAISEGDGYQVDDKSHSYVLRHSRIFD